MDRNLRWLAFGAVVRASGLSLILPFIALYLRDVLGVGYAEIGILVAVLAILPLALSLAGGAIADRLGRRRLFLVSLVLEAGSVLAGGVAMLERSLPGVLAAGAGVGLSGSLGGPALSAYVADLSVGGARTEAFTWFRIGWNLGFTSGVIAGGALIGLFGFATVGLCAGGVLIGSTALLASQLEPTPYDRDRAAGRARPGSEQTAGGTWSTIARDRVFLGFCVVISVAGLSVNQWSTIFPLYANSVLGIPFVDIGIGLALNGVLVVVAQAPTTRAAHGHSHVNLTVLGTALYVAGFVFFGLISLVPGLVLAGFLAAVVVLTMGENVLTIPTPTLPSNLAPPGEVGAYNGAFFAITGVGTILGTTLGGFVLALQLRPDVTWGLLMLPAVPALLFAVAWLKPKVPSEADRA